MTQAQTLRPLASIGCRSSCLSHSPRQDRTWQFVSAFDVQAQSSYSCFINELVSRQRSEKPYIDALTSMWLRCAAPHELKRKVAIASTEGASEKHFEDFVLARPEKPVCATVWRQVRTRAPLENVPA